MNRKQFVFLFLILALAAVGCTRSLTINVANETATEIVVASQTASTTATSPPTATEAAATETETQSPTPCPTETATATITVGAGTPTATPLNFDPNSAFGSPTIFDSFDSSRYWEDGSGKLPNSEFIKLALNSGQMEVTGKLAAFDTWWFTWLSAKDMFVQMQVETDTCSGKQSYGLILRGPPSGDFARGYLLHFSCDGNYRLERLDNTSPYKTEDIISWTASTEINSGSDKTNILGVHLKGSTITIYANGKQIAQVTDGNYISGRFGFFVNGGSAGNYTYSVNELSFWDSP
ncbi:MAG: hypothetical protein DWG76_00195 [Chloroflexi bacterium]|nr:hypothetical protein [Chloroflexota bacterium]